MASVGFDRRDNVLHGPDGMTTRWVLVSAQVAKEWLKRNTANRRLRRMLVERIKIEIESGFYRATHQGVSFGVDGRLLDGQHRLTAIAESGIACWMMVTSDAPAVTATKIDGGATRSLSDQLSISGVVGASGKLVATLRCAFYGLSRSGGTQKFGQHLAEEQAADLLSSWSHELDVASQLHGVPIVGNRFTTGVVVRALLAGQNEDRVAEFCSVLKTGIPIHNEADYAAITLRNAYVEKRLDRASDADRGRDAYLKTEAALESFLRRRSISRLVALAAEAYPIPESRIPESCRLLLR